MGTWKIWFDLSHVAGIHNLGRARDHARYILRKKECDYAITNMADTVRKVPAAWRKLEYERLGFRKTSRIQTRIIFDLPNFLHNWQHREILSSFCRKLFPRHPFLGALHKGLSGEVEQNVHCHIDFLPLDKETDKIDRSMQHTAFLAEIKQILKSEIEKCGVVVTENSSENTRMRLHLVPYQLNRADRVQEIYVNNDTYDEWLARSYKRLAAQLAGLYARQMELDQSISQISTAQTGRTDDEPTGPVTGFGP